MISIRPTLLAITAFAALSTQAQGAAVAHESGRFRSIALKDARAISEAMSVNSAIDAMVRVAASCHVRGMEAALTCACNATGDLNKLKTVYRQTARKHPDWNEPNTVVSYVNPANGHSISLNFSALSAMIDRCERR
jgi:hypothetical protein